MNRPSRTTATATATLRPTTSVSSLISSTATTFTTSAIATGTSAPQETALDFNWERFGIIVGSVLVFILILGLISFALYKYKEPDQKSVQKPDQKPDLDLAVKNNESADRPKYAFFSFSRPATEQTIARIHVEQYRASVDLDAQYKSMILSGAPALSIDLAAQQRHFIPAAAEPAAQQRYSFTPARAASMDLDAQQRYSFTPPPASETQQRYSFIPSPVAIDQQRYSFAPSRATSMDLDSQQRSSFIPTPVAINQQRYSFAPSRATSMDLDAQQRSSFIPAPVSIDQQRYSFAPARAASMDLDAQQRYSFTPPPASDAQQLYSFSPARAVSMDQPRYSFSPPPASDRYSFTQPPASGVQQRFSFIPAPAASIDIPRHSYDLSVPKPIPQRYSYSLNNTAALGVKNGASGAYPMPKTTSPDSINSSDRPLAYYVSYSRSGEDNVAQQVLQNNFNSSDSENLEDSESADESTHVLRNQ